VRHENPEGLPYIYPSCRYTETYVDDLGIRRIRGEDAMVSSPAASTSILRRVTEFTGYLDTDGLPYIHKAGVPEGGDMLCISSICPDETFHPDNPDPPVYHFRFTVEATPVERKEP
jgi:hypothetical protein